MTPRIPFVQSMLDLLRAGNLKGFLARAQEAEPADLGDVLASLDDQQRLEVVRALPRRLSGKALIEMADEAQAEETLASLDSAQAAHIVDELQDDEAAEPHARAPEVGRQRVAPRGARELREDPVSPPSAGRARSDR